jgi:hypothetical protein
MNRKIFALLSLGLISLSIFTRQFETPLPYGLGFAYGKDLFRQALPNLENKNEVDFLAFEIYPSATFYNRITNESFGKNNFNEKMNLSALFHGSDEFEFQNIFSDPSVELAGKNLDNVVLNPEYKYDEMGCVLGVGVQREHEIDGRIWNLRLHANLPVKIINIKNCNQFNKINISNTKINRDFDQKTSDLMIDTKNKTFVIKLNDAIKKGYIKNEINWFEEEKIFFTITPGIDVGQTNDSKSQMDLDKNILNTDCLFLNTGSSDQNFFIQNSLNNLLDGYIANYANPDKLNYYANYSIAFKIAKGKCVIPLGLYKNIPIEYQTLKVDNKEICISPKIIESAEVNNTGLLYTMNIDGETNATNATKFEVDGSNNICPKTVKVKTINIVALNSTILGNKKNNTIEFNDAPVFVQKKSDINTIIIPSYEAMPDHTPITDPNSTDYGLYNNKYEDTKLIGSNLLDNSSYCYVKNDGTLSQNDGSSAVFMYDVDYTNATFTDDLYLTSALKSDGQPTEESNLILNKIYKDLIQQQTLQEQQNAILMTQQILNGEVTIFGNSNTIKQKQKSSGDQSIITPEDSFKKNGIGDLDFELSFGSQWDNNKLSADLIFGAIIPTAPLNNNAEQILSRSLGNNGHYEFRLGSQAAYDVNSWIRLGGYAHWNIVVGENEEILAPFKNASFFGLQPITTIANVSWQNIIASFDVSMFASEWTSISMKYQYFLKTKDKMSFSESQKFDSMDFTEPISDNVMKNYTKRQSHKLLCQFSTAINQDVLLSFGGSTIIAGKNIGQENDLFATLTISY